MAQDYKTKYLDIRAKYLESTDVAYRLGFEKGMKEGQRAAEQAAEQAQIEAEAAAMGGMPPGAEGGEIPQELAPEDMAGGAPEEMGGEEEGSDIDSQISELEGLVAKGEKPTVLTMRKAVESLVDVRKSQKDKWSKKRGQVVSTQKKFVDNILKKWEGESKDVTTGLEDIIKEHGLEVKD